MKVQQFILKSISIVKEDVVNWYVKKQKCSHNVDNFNFKSYLNFILL